MYSVASFDDIFLGLCGFPVPLVLLGEAGDQYVGVVDLHGDEERDRCEQYEIDRTADYPHRVAEHQVLHDHHGVGERYGEQKYLHSHGHGIDAGEHRHEHRYHGEDADGQDVGLRSLVVLGPRNVLYGSTFVAEKLLVPVFVVASLIV